MSGKPNILLIVFDTARADVFEPYGAATGSTPAVAQLAAAGFAHDRTYATSSWTIPSHLSLFSGLLPMAAGLHLAEQANETFRRILNGLGERLLPTVLRGAGYRTVGLSANGWVSRHSGFDLGFDTFQSVASDRNDRLGSKSVRSQVRWATEALRARLDDGAERIERLLSDTASSGQPFFCFVNLVECHSPYLPPKPFNSLGWRDRLRSAGDANKYCTFEAFWKQALGIESVPPDAEARMKMLYLDSIRQLDAWLARVLGSLDAAGLLAETQVIVTSDHGENFGEGGLTGHSFSLDDRLIRVPFVTAGPIDLDVRDMPALSLVDVPYLIGDGLQIADHPWIERRSDPSVVVAEFAAPGRPGDPKTLEGIEAWGMSEPQAAIFTRTFSCATDGRLKLFRDADGESVVDLATDPLEVAANANVARSDLQLRPLEHALDLADAQRALELPELSLSPLGASNEEATQLEARMRLLGYI